MTLFTNNDIEILNDKIDTIIDTIEEKKLEILEPTKKTLSTVNDIVLKFIKDNKRKIYGGYAQNKLIMTKNKDDAFYKSTDVPDIDFYSPEPIIDLVKLCDIIYKEGFKHVEGKEASHKETYSIFVDFTNVCDISYVPRNIYHRIPFIEVNGINYTHPSFMIIDLLRILTEPYFSSFRWKKIFPRLITLEKYYPFSKSKDNLPSLIKIPSDIKDNILKILETTNKFIKNNNTIIIIGDYVYNYYLLESKIYEDKQYSKKYKLLDIFKYELISLDYRADVEKLIEQIKLDNPDFVESLNIVEYYPFWMFNGYSVEILYKEYVVVRIINYNRRCTPYKQVNFIDFNKKPTKTKDNINIGSYDFILLNNIINGMKARVNKLDKEYQYHNIMTSHLLEIRAYYLKKNKISFLDDSIFQQFIATCIGETMDPLREIRIIRDKKFKEGKRAIFKYEPSNENFKIPEYKFPNSSGNQIKNPHNYRIISVGPILDQNRNREIDVKEEVVEEVPEDILEE